jgi:beta-barrel assembly-enhancing protease
LTIRVLINNEPNAFCLPNGSILITTGLLSVLRSEEELLAVLAHEVAHFELDHQILNINKANERQKRAEFWAGFATTLAAAADVYVSVKNDQYIPGTVTLATSALSSEIASYVIDRLGIKYSYKQEIEADDAAAQVMKYLDMNPKTLSSALLRIKNYCIQTRNFYALSGSGTHPTLDKRIARIGDVDPESFNNVKYERIISFVNSNNSIMEFDNGNINAAVELCDRNISAGVPTEMDYLIKAMAIRLLNDTPEKNQEALDLIDKAKTLNITPFSYLFKQEGITLLRLGKNKEAVEAFNRYLNELLQENRTEYIDNEVLWTRKMIAKSVVFAI